MKAADRAISERAFSQYGLHIGHTGSVFMTCRQCGTAGEVVPHGGAGKIPPAFAAKKARRLGWEDRGARWRCPQCVEFNSKERTKMGEGIAPNGTNLRNMRLIMEALGEHFDTDKGCYLHSKSDAVLAKELQLSETVIAKVRTEAFGSIRPQLPAEVVKLQADVADLRAMFQDIETRVGRLVSSHHKPV